MADKKGKGSPADIMSPAEMKPILALAKKGAPVSCAIALTEEKEGVILLDKKRKPKKVFAELKKQAASAGLRLETTSIRYGRASIDTDQEAGLVTMTVNKEAPGALRPKLLESLKKAGFGKLEIIVEEGLEEESEEDETEGQGASAGGTAASIPPPPPPPPMPPPPQKPVAPPTAQEPTSDKPRAGIVEFQKSRLIWLAARKKVAGEIDQLKEAIVEEFEDDEDEAEAMGALDQLDEVLLNFDASLVDKLDDLLNASDEATRTKLSGEVKHIVAGYIGYIKSNPLVAQLEGDSPFGVKLSVGSTLLNTLKVLGSQLR